MNVENIILRENKSDTEIELLQNLIYVYNIFKGDLKIEYSGGS
jgi:hypothetical protein